MIYSDTSAQTGLLQDCEFLTGIDDGNISGNTSKKQHFTRLLNIWYHRAITIILTSQDEWQYDDNNNTDLPSLRKNLVANQRDYGLPISDKLMKVERLEVTYDGVNWYKAEPLEKGEIGVAITGTDIDARFSTTKPFYDLEGNSLFLYPKPTTNVTAGLRIWMLRDVREFTTSDTSLEPSFDRDFHRFLSLGASYDWCFAKGLPQTPVLKQELMEMEGKIRQFFGKKQEDRQGALGAAYINYN